MDTMIVDSNSATGPAFWLTAASLPMLNSSPSENISRITPSSDSVWTVFMSATSGSGMCGPTIMPANRYPKTTGWRRRWNNTVATAATSSTTARLCRKTTDSMPHNLLVKKKRPPNFRWPFLLSEELRRVLGVCLVLEGQSIGFTYPIEHCIDRDADAAVVQHGLIAGSTLEPTLEIGSWLSAATTRRTLFFRAGIRTIHVHSASTSCSVLAISTLPRNAGFEPNTKYNSERDRPILRLRLRPNWSQPVAG